MRRYRGTPKGIDQSEFSGADFGDARLGARLVQLAAALSREPASSLPEAMGSEAALEASYRFLNNTRVDPALILTPHWLQTEQRIKDATGDVIVAHDTTEFSFQREQAAEGLTQLSPMRAGFLGHFALAIRGDGTKHPLGVCHAKLWARVPRASGQPYVRPSHDISEARRWEQAVGAVSERFSSSSSRLIHVMDREADKYGVLAALVGARRRFVVRVAHDRVSGPEGARQAMSDQLAATAVHFDVVREVRVSRRRDGRRPNKSKLSHPARVERKATLAIAAGAVCFDRPNMCDAESKQLTLNVVWVYERNPPDDCEPIEWRLMTTEPIDTAAQVEAIIDAYRARWVIEEYFRVLKTGCAIEKRQVENARALFNVVAVFAPIAWRLLHLRTLARLSGDQPSNGELSPSQLVLLRQIAATRHHHNLPLAPTNADVLAAIAALGGRIKHNGEAGWIVLARGYEKFLDYEQGARAFAMIASVGGCAI
jgi:hypothetical protein